MAVRPAPPAATAKYEPVRVVLSLPVVPRAAATAAAPPRPSVRSIATALPRPAGRPALLHEFRDALAQGREAAAVELLAAAKPEDRMGMYADVGRLLRSAATAERILDLVPPSEQLAACRAWSRLPGFRPAVFTRLRSLAADPLVDDEVERVLDEMAADPSLTPYLRSYQLSGRVARTSG